VTKPVPIISAGQATVGDVTLASLPDGTVLAGNNNGPGDSVGGDLGELNVGIDASTTTIQFFPSAYNGFPAVPSTPFAIDVEQEVMTVTQIAADGTTWSVKRGQDGTTASQHGIGAAIDLVSKLAVPVADATTTSIHLPASSGFPSPSPTTLTTALNDTTATVKVKSTAGFPIQSYFLPFTIQVDREMMTVTQVNGTSLTVKRGTQGTTATSHPLDAPVTAVYHVQIDQEIMEVTGVSADGTTLTVARGSRARRPSPTPRAPSSTSRRTTRRP